jgi:2-amino-4-hydroxy-6-hydroxymethyldihydropteridine diphosphokinase
MIEARIAWLGLGSNVGRRDQALAALRSALRADGVLLITDASPILMTRSVGVTRLPDYHNQVLRVEAQTPLHPLAWLRRCEAAQHTGGRRQTYRWGPRRADADILLLGPAGEVRVDEPELAVPHPELRNRPFWCALLASIDPALEHPDGWRFADNAGKWGQVAHPPPHV